MSTENPLHDLSQHLETLPGIGPKSAQRLALFLLSRQLKDVEAMAHSMVHTRKAIRYCDICFNLSFQTRCHICEDHTRKDTSLCVVAHPKDIMALERIRIFGGHYHVLGGLLSPLDGIHPETLRINELVDRIKTTGYSDLILGINSTIEGDTTMLYLTNLLQHLPVTISKLAYGLPAGSDLDYADDMTLQKAFMGRQAVTT